MPNSINLTSKGSVPVAILGSATFDVHTINPAAVYLAGLAFGCTCGDSIQVKNDGTLMYSFEDVNGDGFIDMVVHFPTPQLTTFLTPSDTQVILSGYLFPANGQGYGPIVMIEGFHSVRVPQ